MQSAIFLITVLLALPQAPDTLKVARVTGVRNTSARSSAPLQRMTDRQLQNTGAITLQEALRTFAGVSVKDYGGLGGMKTVSVRSFGSQHTGIVYDGQVISNAQNGQVDIGRFNLDDVRAVTMEIGGSDDIFRPARLASSAGVLTVESARPAFDSTGTRASAQIRYGSFNTWNPYVSVSQRLGDRWSAVLWGNYIKSAGNYPFILHNGSLVTKETRLHSDVSSFNGEASLYGSLGTAGDLSLRLAYFQSERGLPGSVVLYTQNPAQRLWDRDFRASALYDVSMGDAWKLRASGSYNSAWNRFVDYDPIHSVEDIYLQQEGNVSITALYSPFERLSASIAQDVAYNVLDSSMPGCPFPSRITSYTALSAKYGGERLTAVLTLLGTVSAEWVQIGDPSPRRMHLGPSASLSYRIGEDFRLRASFKDSYRLPTFNDLYYARVGNRKLEPEKALQTNVGVIWSHSFGRYHASASADGYWNAVRDRIVAVPSMFIWSMRNVGRVRMLGSDLSLSFRGKVAGWLDVQASANYSYQYAVDVTDPSQKNYMHQIAYTPRHCGSGSVTLETPWANLGYTVQAVGERYTLAQNTPAYRTDPYADHAMSLNREFAFGRSHVWKLRAGVEALNLAGVNYEVIKYYPMPGRQFRLTIKITY